MSLGIMKYCLCGRHNIKPRNFDRTDQLEKKEYDLYTADDGEASEEPHGASDETQLSLCLDLLVPLDLVEGGRVKVDLYQLQG